MATAAVISIGVAAPAGLAQYGESPNSGGIDITQKLGPPAAPGSPQRRAQLRLCIAKAQTKFGDNRPKKKAAIKKCKKRYG
ncbi:MAG: hypothetical protein ACJ75Z_12970 [Solirubrobacterales bacterium]